MDIAGMPRDFHRQLLLAEGLKGVIDYLTEGIAGEFAPQYPAEIEIDLQFGKPTISDGGHTAQGLIEISEAVRKATFLKKFLELSAGLQAIVCTNQNAIDLNWVNTSTDEILLCRYDEDGWSEPNFVLKPCRFHTYRINSV